MINSYREWINMRSYTLVSYRENKLSEILTNQTHFIDDSERFNLINQEKSGAPEKLSCLDNT